MLIRKVGLDGVITTVAGNGGAGAYSGDGGPATSAGLSCPNAVAADAVAISSSQTLAVAGSAR